MSVEALEERVLLSTWTVNSLGDTGTGTGLTGDLRYVITQADKTAGDNTINFSVTGTITLNSALPDLSNTTGLTDIEGPGPTSLTVARNSAAGTPHFGIFTVDAHVETKIAGLTITGGISDSNGGGIENFGDLTVTSSTIANNRAGNDSGGIDNAGTMTITNSTIASNQAIDPGGGILNNGTLTVTDSTIANNFAYLDGGGILNNGTLTVADSTIADNFSAHGDGSGIENSGTATITNSTIASNSTGILFYSGGGINNGGTLTVTNSTIANNDSGDNGGGINNGGTAILDNTIVALNNSAIDSDIAGTVSSSSAYNLIGTGGTGGLVDGVNGNQVGVANPGLGPLANYGGPTQTFALLPGSPAIDKGSNALAVDPTTGKPLTTDQRGPGFKRIVNGTVDIGAFEYLASSVLVVSAQPPASVVAGSGFGLAVTVEDPSGPFNGTVTVALSNNPGGATLGGTLSVTAQGGVATFSGLTLNKVGTGYTLLVSSNGLIAETTTPFNVTPAAAAQLLVTNQPPASLAAGAGFRLVVAAEDQFGNMTPDFIGSVSVALSNNSGGATLGGTLSVTATSGVATFPRLTLNKPGTGYTLQVSSTGLTAATTKPFNVTAVGNIYTVNSLGDTGTGSGLSGDLRYVITQADSSPGGTIDFIVTGTIQLAAALPDLSADVVINGPGAAELSVARSSAAGTPDFGIFRVDSYVQATVVGLTITGGSTGGDGGGINNSGTLTVTNSAIANNLGSGINNDGTLTVTNSTIANNSSDGIGNNTGTVAVTNSTIADNSGSGIGNNGVWYDFGTVTVTNSTIANNSGSGIDNSFDIFATATLYNTIVALNNQDLTGHGMFSSSSAYNLIGTGGSGGLANGVNGNQVGVANPELGTLADNGGPTHTIALLPGSPAIDMGKNALAVDPTTGQPLTTDQRGPGFDRIAHGTVDIGAFEFEGSFVGVTAQPPASVTAGSGFGLTVTIMDKSGHVDSSFNGTVTVAIAKNPGGATLGGTLSVTATTGVATFSGLTLNKTGTGYTLEVSSDGLNTATTNPLSVTPAAASRLAVINQPRPSVAAGAEFSLVAAAEDQFGNMTPDFIGSVSVALSNNPGGATLGGTLSVTAHGGEATFSGLTLSKPGIGYTLQISSNGLSATTTSPFDVGTVGNQIYTVNSLGDTGAGTGNAGDLRYVLTRADENTGNNTINFSVTGTITLSSAPPDLSNTTGFTDIEGPGTAKLSLARNSAVGTPDFRIFTVHADVQAELVGLTITGGFAYGVNGGGIENAGTLTVSNGAIVDNSASPREVNYNTYGGLGGGIYNSGTLTITNSTIANNSAQGFGSGIGNSGTLTINNSTIANNSGGEGGGIENGSIDIGGGIGSPGMLTINNCTIANNSAYLRGGGIDNGGTLRITNSTIANNTANFGGGIQNLGALTIDNSTIANNSATGAFGYGGIGGGIGTYGTLTITNSTIANNSATGVGTFSGAGGGGIDNGGTLTVANSTIANNSDDDIGGGGLAGSATLYNTIIASNFGGGAPGSPVADDISGTVSSSSAYNLIGTGGSGGLVNGVNGNQVGVADPGLGPLANYGGTTQTIALLPGSPAIDKGSNALAVDPSTGKPLTTDQRGTGFVRIDNGRVDIGAYEFLPAVTDSVAVGWGTQTASLQTAADGLRLLPAGRKTDLPWLGINQLQLTLSQAQTLIPADVTINSAIGVNYGPVTVSGSGKNYTITLARPVSAADRLTVTIVNPGISMFNRRLDILPGDINDDGVVNIQDAVLVRNQILGITPMTIFGDINGDGKVDINDLKAVRKRLGTTLPPIT